MTSRTKMIDAKKSLEKRRKASTNRDITQKRQKTARIAPSESVELDNHSTTEEKDDFEEIQPTSNDVDRMDSAR